MYGPQECVQEFHKAFELPAPSKPTFDEFTEVRIVLIQEELDELFEAFCAKDMIACIDALADLEYVVNGAAVALGVDLQPFFAEVHANNMTKVHSDGTVKYREDGKVLKPESYQPVDLESVYRKVYNDDPS